MSPHFSTTEPLHADDVHWMQLAMGQARLAADLGEVPVGAVVVQNGQLVSVGRNAPVATHDPSAHAEVVALREAARVLGNYRLNACTLYVTLEPCAMCSGAMLHARLARVVYGAPDPKTGAAGSVVNLFALPRLNPQTRVQGRVLASECGQLLKDFFATRRHNPHPLRDDALRTAPERWQGLQDWPWTRHAARDWPQLQGLQLAWFDTAEALTVAADRGVCPAVQCVCLHPDGAWAYAWRHVARELTDSGWRVLMPDLIGFGHSDKPKKAQWHSPERHVQALHAWAQHLGVSQAVWLVPHSGTVARIANQLLSQHPELATALVLLQGSQPGDQAPSPLFDHSLLAYQAPFADPGYEAGPRAFQAGWAEMGQPASSAIAAATWAELVPHGLDQPIPCQRLAQSLVRAAPRPHATSPNPIPTTP